MSSADGTSLVRACPACQGVMGAMDTICDSCRAQLESHVMSVTAADYPEPTREIVTDDLGVPVADAMDPQLAAAVAQDPDLLPLAPLDEPRAAAMAAAATSSLPAPAPSVPPAQPAAAPQPPAAPQPKHAAAAPRAPASAAKDVRPAPPVPVIERPVVLNPPNRWKPIALALICIAVSAIVAAVIWSYIVPRNDDQPLQHNPTTTRAQ